MNIQTGATKRNHLLDMNKHSRSFYSCSTSVHSVTLQMSPQQSTSPHICCSTSQSAVFTVSETCCCSLRRAVDFGGMHTTCFTDPQGPKPEVLKYEEHDSHTIGPAYSVLFQGNVESRGTNLCMEKWRCVFLLNSHGIIVVVL